MALGDGTQWDETEPTQSTEANTIDSYERDIRVGVRSRMQNEHWWPSAQTGTAQAGQHTFLTLQKQSAFPGFVNNNSGTSLQTAGIWIDNTNNLWYTAINSSGTANYPLISNTGIVKGSQVAGLIGASTTTTVSSAIQVAGDTLIYIGVSNTAINWMVFVGAGNPPTTGPNVQYPIFNGAGNNEGFTTIAYVPAGYYYYISTTGAPTGIYGPYSIPLGVSLTA